MARTDLLSFIRAYRLKISSKTRWKGVGDTLLGLALLSICTVFFPFPKELVAAESSLLLSFFAGALLLISYAFLKQIFSPHGSSGLKGLFFMEKEEVLPTKDKMRLSLKERIRWIYFRGLASTGAYITLNISKVYLENIDNSQIVGADTLIYAVLGFLFLHQRYNVRETLGILIATAGIFYILYYDVQLYNWQDGSIAVTTGLLSAFALALLYFITAIIVRHDPPHRVAFHQCLVGVGLSLLALLATLVWKGAPFPSLSFELVRNSILSGILYMVALLFFLRAWLYSEPIILAVMGYTFPIFVALLEWLFFGHLMSYQDLISAFLITLGCSLLIREEYKKDRRHSHATHHKPLYLKDLKEELLSLKKQFQEGSLDRESYFIERQEFHRILYAYSSLIKNSKIKSIEIVKEGLIFKFLPLNIELESDDDPQSPSFEMLNFENYEPEVERMVYTFLHDGAQIIDIGAGIGWYTLNFAKRFPRSTIFAFEAAKAKFAMLQKNVKRNQVENVRLFPYLLEGERSLDSVLLEENIARVDFIRCQARGEELALFQGAIEVLKKFHPTILIEFHEGWGHKLQYELTELLAFFHHLGYASFQIDKEKLQKIDSTGVNFSPKIAYYFFLKK